MDINTILSQLVDIADDIDTEGRHIEADMITNVIVKLAASSEDLSDPLLNQQRLDMIKDLKDVKINAPENLTYEQLQEMHKMYAGHVHNDPEREQLNPFLNHTTYDPGFGKID